MGLAGLSWELAPVLCMLPQGTGWLHSSCACYISIPKVWKKNLFQAVNALANTAMLWFEKWERGECMFSSPCLLFIFHSMMCALMRILVFLHLCRGCLTAEWKMNRWRRRDKHTADGPGSSCHQCSSQICIPPPQTCQNMRPWSKPVSGIDNVPLDIQTCNETGILRTTM